MLRYDTPNDFSTSRPELRLFAMVLLMSIRDRASEVRFRLADNAIDIAYEVDGVWKDMVPFTSQAWPVLLTEVRDVAKLVRPDRGGWWHRTRTEDPETGWLTFRLRGHDNVFRVQLDANELRLDLLGELSQPDEVVAVLQQLVALWHPLPDGPLPPDAPRADV